MGLAELKITDNAIATKGVVAAPDKLTGTAAANKAVFDRLVRDVVADVFNKLVDALVSTENASSGAGAIGVSEINGVTGNTVQTVLEGLKIIADSKAAAADTEAALGTKADVKDTDLHIKSILFDPTTGVFRFTRQNGADIVIDTLLEKIAINFEYDSAAQALVLTLQDGTVQRIHLSSFVTETEFEDSSEVSFSVVNHTVTAKIKPGSITDTMLSSALTATLQSYVSTVSQKATDAAASASAAAGSAATASQKATEAAGSATTAGTHASTSGNAASSASSSAQRAEKAALAAEKARDEAASIVGGNFITDEQLTKSISDHNVGSTAHADIRQKATDAADAATAAQKTASGKLDAPSGGTAGQVLTKTDTGSKWANTYAPRIIVTAPSDTAQVNVNSDPVPHGMTESKEGNVWTFVLPRYGTYEVVCVPDQGTTQFHTVVVDCVKDYEVDFASLSEPIYGAEWDGTAAKAWARTDDAVLFTDPAAALTNGAGSSPFDGIAPWSEMTKVTFGSDVFVKIPKFYYKITRAGGNMKIQISMGKHAGFSVSPAHADRGDGKGERDTVYVARYHCGTSQMASKSGQTPISTITRQNARNSIVSSKGAGFWQYDFRMHMTICLLFLVEYANWNCQQVIGLGSTKTTGSKIATGATDSMAYHTGTTAANRTALGICQYRNIESLWGNVFTWLDGMYFTDDNVYVIDNPAKFGIIGGRYAGRRCDSRGWTVSFSEMEDGYDWAFVPSVVSTGGYGFIGDYYDRRERGDSRPTVPYVGGDYEGVAQYTGYPFGLFYQYTSLYESESFPTIGCRMIYLP